MGKEQTCDAVIDGVRTHGLAMLETDDVQFRRAEGAHAAKSTPRLKVLLKDIKKVILDGEHLELRHKGGVVRLSLGAKQAAAWAKRILEPPGLLDKLGVKEGTTVTVAGGIDEDFVHSLELRGAVVRRGRKGKDADLVFLGVETLADLNNVAGLAKLMRPAGGIWFLYPKGRKDLREADVMAAGRAAGWKDNKTCRVSETHTALRFVIPLADRPAGATAAAKRAAAPRSAGRSKGR